RETVSHREARLLLHNKFVVVLGDSSEQFFSTFTTYKCVLSTVLITVCLNESYNPNWTADYKENLKRFFDELKMVLPEESLVIWNLTMPLGKRIKGGFLVPEVKLESNVEETLRYDVIEANFYGWTLADAYEMDVLDLHFQFRFSLQHRTTDGIHWNAIAHRRITALLLQHIAQAWGVTLAAEGEDGNINALFVSEVPDQKSSSRVCDEDPPQQTPLRPVHPPQTSAPSLSWILLNVQASLQASRTFNSHSFHADEAFCWRIHVGFLV
uniref:Family with sequence similarity 113 n=1 Tax=Fundulus heteroclitus TaxID=8078 RepID=A0A3Q2Q0A6_FUNHE